jgi:DNA-binding NarL/FixJ family response regulator
MDKQEISILIVDDCELIREGLRRLIILENDLNVVGEAENASKALSLLKTTKADVVILDISLPLMDGIEVLKLIKNLNESTKVIFLTMENNNKIVRSAIEAGADGYVLKKSKGIEIINAIGTVYRGEKYIDKSLVSQLFLNIQAGSKNVSSILDVLSKREIEVLMKISKGLSNKEIGTQLYLSEKTIKNYISNLFKKINTRDRVRAAILALENDIENYYKTKYND